MPEDRSISPANRTASREQLPPINAGPDTTQLISDLKILANRVFALSNPPTPAWDEPDRKANLIEEFLRPNSNILEDPAASRERPIKKSKANTKFPSSFDYYKHRRDPPVRNARVWPLPGKDFMEDLRAEREQRLQEDRRRAESKSAKAEDSPLSLSSTYGSRQNGSRGEDETYETGAGPSGQGSNAPGGQDATNTSSGGGQSGQSGGQGLSSTGGDGPDPPDDRNRRLGLPTDRVDGERRTTDGIENSATAETSETRSDTTTREDARRVRVQGGGIVTPPPATTTATTATTATTDPTAQRIEATRNAENMLAMLTTQTFRDAQAPDHPASNHTASNHSASNHSASNHSASNHSASNHSASDHSASDHQPPGNQHRPLEDPPPRNNEPSFPALLMLLFRRNRGRSNNQSQANNTDDNQNATPTPARRREIFQATLRRLSRRRERNTTANTRQFPENEEPPGA